LLTYVRRRDIAGAVPIAKWLVSQRNSLGGFSSTQVINSFLFFFAKHLACRNFLTVFITYGKARDRRTDRGTDRQTDRQREPICMRCRFFRLLSDSIFTYLISRQWYRPIILSVECTQDTVVALQALAEYAALTSGNNAGQNLAITVTADTLMHSFSITAANALVLQSVQVYFTLRILNHIIVFFTTYWQFVAY